MIVCLCEGMSDRELRTVVDAGCDSVRELVRQTGVGSHCGQCACELKRIVGEARRFATSGLDDGGAEPLPLAAK